MTEMRVREETKSRSQVAISEVHLTWPVRLVGCVSVAQFSSPRNECKTKVQHLRGGRPIDDIKKERADSILTRVIIPYLSSNRIAIGCRSLLAGAGVAPFVQTCDRHRGPAALPFCHCASRPSRVLRARARARVRAPVARGSRRRTCWLAWQDGLRIHIHPPLPLSAAWLVVHTHNSTSVIAAKKTVAILH